MKAIVKEVRSSAPKRYAAVAIIDIQTGEELFRSEYQHDSESASLHSDKAIASWERWHPEYELVWR